MAVGMGGGMALAQSGPAQNAVQNLDHGWQFRQITAKPQPSEYGWMSATVPGDVHLDLLANKKISDPFFRDNESKLQWIENEAWEYRTTFEVTPAMLARSHVDLVFDGLDATAEIYLNSVRVLDANNSFRTWRVPAKARLHVGKNLLYVVFPSPIKAAAKVAESDPLMSTAGIGDRALSPAASGSRCGWRRGISFASPILPFVSAT
jgi:beta-mannosidase